MRELITKKILTPIGEMVAVADDEKLYALLFVDQPTQEERMTALAARYGVKLREGNSPLLEKVQNEIDAYFAGTLTEFTIPLQFTGTSFQQQAWRALISIPYGCTRSYSEQSFLLAKPTAFRAVANANGLNVHAIIVPCHRVVRKSHEVGGYNGGIWRKKWLLEHEQRLSKNGF